MAPPISDDDEPSHTLSGDSHDSLTQSAVRRARQALQQEKAILEMAAPDHPVAEIPREVCLGVERQFSHNVRCSNSVASGAVCGAFFTRIVGDHGAEIQQTGQRRGIRAMAARFCGRGVKPY